MINLIMKRTSDRWLKMPWLVRTLTEQKHELRSQHQYKKTGMTVSACNCEGQRQGDHWDLMTARLAPSSVGGVAFKGVMWEMIEQET